MASSSLENLLSKFAANGLSEEERRHLASLLQQESVQQDMVDIVQDWMLKEVASELFDEARFMPMLKKLLESDKPVRKGMLQQLRKPWLRYAAAAVLLAALVSTISIIVQKNSKETIQRTANDQQAPTPGGNHATLTLSDGRKIILDSAQGNIMQQGRFLVTNENGKLDYEGASGKIENHTLSTPRGGQYQLRLPDGTQVWLNTASSISFPTSFNGVNRSVTITGEAYFEVAKNKDMPFIVNVNNKASVEVLGTHFNIRSYPEESAIKTTLLEGKVKVLAAGDNKQSAILQPGEQANIKNEQLQVHQYIDVDATVAWKAGLFDFSEADLPIVMRELSRWYNIEVRYEGPLPTDLYEGRIPMSASLEDVLKLLEKNDVRFRLKGKTLTVLTGKNK
ncbi:FecR family protein [Pseudoflavitalea rhizosphaerae]|uniref:FecR family protein n=1 Tax=Pseudoflavitalea rhizosphaerae TaxID=1884793 RepID=UPI000F8E160E|nr:FecR family protein [Pseudoflavitalea rhizosphaerae]